MIINFVGSYKSLKTFVSDDLGNFALITGKNGTGKSQLVQLLSSVTQPQHTTPYQISVIPKITNLQVEGIAFGTVSVLKGEQVAKQFEHTSSAFFNIRLEIKILFDELLTNGLKTQEVKQYFDLRPFMSGSDIKQKNQRIIDYCNKSLGGIDTSYRSEQEMIDKQITKLSGYLYQFKKSIHSAINVSSYKKKKFSELDRNDFYSSPLDETYYTNDTAFTVQIENLFYGYARKRFINEMEFNRKINYNIQNQSISVSEFVQKFPEPWVQINKILEKHNLKLRVVEIKIEDFSPEIEFDFHLIDISNNIKIKFEELSSGEKIIVGLIIRLFLTERYKNEFNFPDCIIFDEPDAFLHPEMSYLLLEVLYNTFVSELGIKVIITTHSPSTVALAPDDCIFELGNVPTTSLRKVSKNEALKVLTGNLPLLSVDYTNHRQVFVESPTDQYYFQTIFNKLKSEKKNIYELYFITTGYGKSNCTEVIKLTNELRNAGNKTSYGIIDWDNSNEPSDYIEVNGYKKRYSIENFIFDPLHLCILFIEQKCANNISALGFDNSFNQYSIAQENDAKIQEISNWFFKKIEIEFPNSKLDNLIEIEYINSKKINVPDWYLKTKGHDIEVKLRKTFPSLAAFRNEGGLQKKLTEIASKCYPLVPVEPFEILRKLSTCEK